MSHIKLTQAQIKTILKSNSNPSNGGAEDRLESKKPPTKSKKVSDVSGKTSKKPSNLLQKPPKNSPKKK